MLASILLPQAWNETTDFAFPYKLDNFPLQTKTILPGATLVHIVAAVDPSSSPLPSYQGMFIELQVRLNLLRKVIIQFISALWVILK